MLGEIAIEHRKGCVEKLQHAGVGAKNFREEQLRLAPHVAFQGVVEFRIKLRVHRHAIDAREV